MVPLRSTGAPRREAACARSGTQDFDCGHRGGLNSYLHVEWHWSVCQVVDRQRSRRWRMLPITRRGNGYARCHSNTMKDSGNEAGASGWGASHRAL